MGKLAKNRPHFARVTDQVARWEVISSATIVSTHYDKSARRSHHCGGSSCYFCFRNDHAVDRAYFWVRNQAGTSELFEIRADQELEFESHGLDITNMCGTIFEARRKNPAPNSKVNIEVISAHSGSAGEAPAASLLALQSLHVSPEANVSVDELLLSPSKGMRESNGSRAYA